MGQHGQRKAEKEPCLVKVYFQEGYTCKSKYIQMVEKNKAPFIKKISQHGHSVMVIDVA